MTLRLDAGAAGEMVRAHFDASHAVGTDVGAPEPDAGEATDDVRRLLEAFLRQGENLAQVNDSVAVQLRVATDNIEGTDLQIAQAFASGMRPIA